MKNVCSLLIVCLFTIHVAAQNNGFYGKKTYIEFNGMAQLALANRIGYGNYKYYGKSLVEKSDLLNGGFNIAAGIAAKRSFMFGVEAGFWYFNVAGPSELPGDDSYYGIPIRHEMLDVRTFSLVPTFTFGGKKGLLPVGINHQVGIGYTRSKVLKKDYNYRPESSYYNTTQAELDSMYTANGGFVDYKNSYPGFTASYTLKVRIPVSKAIMINYALRYSLNFTSTSTSPSGNFEMPNSALQTEISNARFNTLLTLNVGVTLAL